MRKTGMSQFCSGVVVVALVFGTGCTGGDEDTSSTQLAASEEVVDTTAADTTTTTLPPGEFVVAGEWKWTFETEDGYRTSGFLELGAVTAAREAPGLPGMELPAAELGGYCSEFDPSTDALIPARVTLTNDTEGFSNRLSSTFYLAATETEGALIRTASDDLLHVVALYSAGPDCHPLVTADGAFFSEGEGWGLSFGEPVEPGEPAGPHYAYLILPDFYSPSTPNGDIARLSTVGLALVPAMRSDDAPLTSLTGPDAQFQATGGGFLFTSLAPGN